MIAPPDSSAYYYGARPVFPGDDNAIGAALQTSHQNITSGTISSESSSCSSDSPAQKPITPSLSVLCMVSQSGTKRPNDNAFSVSNDQTTIPTTTGKLLRRNSNSSISTLGETSVATRDIHTSIRTRPQKPVYLEPRTAWDLLEMERDACQEENIDKLFLIPPSSDGSCSYNQQRNSWLKLRLGITELAGAAGSGKSQMAMSLCVQAVLNSSSKATTTGTYKAMYISLGDGQQSSQRIAQRLSDMAGTRLQEDHPPQLGLRQDASEQHNAQASVATARTTTSSSSAANSETADSVLSQILTHSVRNQDDLLRLLRLELPQRLRDQQRRSYMMAPQSHPVGVIVLDSIANLFRMGNDDGIMEHDTESIAQRSSLLFQIASLLKQLSQQFCIPVVVINQVSDDLDTKRTIPTLGMSWANCVNTSYFLKRPHLEGVLMPPPPDRPSSAGAKHGAKDSKKPAPSDTIQTARSRRQIVLTKSSHHPVRLKASFKIDKRGVVPL